MTIPNYLALYNLSQIEADILIVSDLTATTGTIYTLNSTTGTITTLNSTTANITNLIGDIWQGTSTTSDMRIGSASDTAGTITIYKNTTLATNKNLTLGGTGKITTPNILVSGLTASKLVLTDASDNLISSLYTDSDFARLTADNSFSGLNSFTQKVRCNSYQAITTSSISQLFTELTLNAIYIGNTANPNVIQLSQPISCIGDVFISSNKNLTMSAGTGKITTPNILVSGLTASKLVLTDASDNLISSLYTDSDFARLTASNIFTGATNTFNNKILCNTYTGLTSFSTIDFGESGDSGQININRPMYCQRILSINTGVSNELFTNTLRQITIGNTSSSFGILLNQSITMASAKNISLSGGGSISVSTNGIISCYQYQSTSPVQFLALGSTNTTSEIYIGQGQTSGDCFIGNTTPASDTGLLTINKNTTINSTKILRATKISGNTVSGDITFGDSTSDTGYIYSNRNIAINGGKNLTINNSGGNIYCDNYNSYNGVNDIKLLQNIVLSVDKNLTLSGTGKITTPGILVSGLTASKIVLTDASKNIISSAYDETTLPVSTPAQTALNLKANIDNPTFTTAIGLTSGNLTISSGTILANTFTGLTTSSSINLFTTASVSSPTITLGSITGGTFTIRPDTNIVGNTTISSNLLCNTYRGSAVGSAISLFSTTTTGSIGIGGGLSSGNINLGLIGMTGKISCNANVEIGTSAANKGISCNYIQSFGVGDTVSTYPTSTTGNLNICGSHTSGNITIGNSTPANDTGNLTINKNVILATAKTLTANTFQGTTVGSNINLFSLTTGTINIGNLAGSGTIFLDNNVEINSTKILYVNTVRGYTPGSSITIGGDMNSGNLTMCAAISTGNINIGNLAGTGLISLKNKTLCNTIESFAVGTGLTIGGNITTGNSTLFANMTSGYCYLGDRQNTTSLGFQIRTKFQQQRNIGGTPYASYWNVSSGAVGIFQSSILSAFAMPPVYAGAQTNGWSVWESDTVAEGSFIAQNGDTTIICNPGDNFAFHWQDEDSMATAAGFKFSNAGVMTITSDARSKTNIKPYNKNNLLNKLNKIDIINYTKKRPDGITRPGADQKYAKIHTGYTAQQLIEIGLDEFVEQPTTPDGYMSVSYGNIQFLFNAGVQELIKENRQQQKQIDAIALAVATLEKEKTDLTARLEKLEKLLIPV